MGNLVGSKIADKITSGCKSKNKGKEENKGANGVQEIYINPMQTSINYWCFKIFFGISRKMEYQKIINLPETTSVIHDQSGKSCNINKQIRFKISMLRSDICDYYF